MVLKKKLDAEIPNACVCLYDDFDPSAVGVNVNTMILKYASVTSPVVIVINEVDTFFDQVYVESPMYDTREQHTRGKQSFNNMMDAIASAKHVILICTTELSVEQLRKKKEWRSFMRPGRIDFFVSMTDANSVRVRNDAVDDSDDDDDDDN